ncbi:hypothetical protein [Streptomyces erythrochromogenes]|uniref:hypothetical protein n=1 Tax=Streptomyces erythrochromogenes TaxID=285574 RepID=UPI00386C82A6|nr:hypothetical protein OG364_24710 [Streptomyces erythrochromogenes]
MAEDNGGILAVGLSGDIAASIRAQADAQARAAALRIQYESLSDYQKLVDDLLASLQKSPAHHGKLADGALPTGALGAGFPEADNLYKAYKTVHNELQKLSKGLAVQIEALGIAVQSASGGYAEVDEETKRRMGLLAKQAHDEYVRDRDPYAKKDDIPQPNGKGGVLG